MNRFLSLAVGLLALIVSSSVPSFAQIKNEAKTLIIKDGDTIVNGKSISKADKQTRKEILEEIRQIEKRVPRIGSKDNEIIIRRKGDADKEIEIYADGKNPHILFWDKEAGARMRNFPRDGVFSFEGSSDSLNLSFNGDSLFRTFKFKMNGLDSLPESAGIRGNFERLFPGNRGMFEPNSRHFFPSLGLKKNSSQFSYNYVDRDGIEDRINIGLSDVAAEQFKKISGSTESGNTLEVKDLTVFPDFSNGGLNLTFKLSSSGNTRIRVHDSSLSEIFSDTDIIVNSAYLKSLPLNRNGVYYLSINQGSKWFVKRLVRQ